MLYRLDQAEEQFRHFLKELDYAYRLLEEQPLAELVSKYHPISDEVRDDDQPKGPPLTIKEKEEAIREIIHMKREFGTTDFVIKSPQKEKEELKMNEEQQRAVQKEEMEKTLQQNQRLMDVAENTDLLLNQYAGATEEEGMRAPKQTFLFYQQKNPIVAMDEGVEKAALRILNISR